MNPFKVFYDEEEDILYLAKEGNEHEFGELSPGIHAELDENGALIGIELFNASILLKKVLNPIRKRAEAA